MLLAIGLLALLAWITLSWVLIRPPSYQPARLLDIELLPWPQHNEIYTATDFPYVLSAKQENGALEYVGALHTSDATEPQLKEIESRWEKFSPTVAFCEGRKRMYRFSSRVKNGTLSESDLVRILAYQNGVQLYTLEPTYEQEVAGLLTEFDSKMVAAYMTIRVYSAEASGVEKSNRDQLALALLRKRTSVPALESSISSIAEMDQFWKANFASAPGWRDLSSPDKIPQLRKVGDVSRVVRGRHMVSSIMELVEKGERVFAVVGASHVIRQKPAIEKLLSTP